IDYDQVEPFPELGPKTISEKAAIKFKPTLFIKDGCHPYAAVNAAGDTSGGLDPKASDDECKGSTLGSQVYSRSTWYRNTWATMYAWYFPKDTNLYLRGVRHDWVSAIVWLDNPALANQTLIGVSFSSGGASYGGFHLDRSRMWDGYVDGTHPKMEYSAADTRSGYHTIDASEDVGDFQDLIHWSQLTEEARNALETGDFGSDTPVPFNNANFKKNLERGF
ncbi:necrosis inducing-like protein NPP1 type, partial [Phytophthora sojae]